MMEGEFKSEITKIKTEDVSCDDSPSDYDIKVEPGEIMSEEVILDDVVRSPSESDLFAPDPASVCLPSVSVNKKHTDKQFMCYEGESNINRNFSRVASRTPGRGSHSWDALVGMSQGHAHSIQSRPICFPDRVTMSEQEVPPQVAQRIIIKFLTREGVKPAEILRRLKPQFGESCLKKTQVYEWHKKFLEGREAVENEPHARRPRTSLTQENIDTVRRLVEGDRRLTVSEIASEVGISFGSAQTIITKFRPDVCLLK